MKILNDNVLHVGDIILTTTTGKMSKGIRGVTNSDISHAMVLVQPTSLVDSTMKGVHSKSTRRQIFEDDAVVHVLRLCRPLSSLERDKVVNYARDQIGAEYTIRQAIQSVTGPKNAPSRRQFCSRLVGRAYAAAGIQLVDAPDFCSPADLLRSSMLREVADATQHISDSETAAIEQIPDTTAEMSRATNKLLEGARRYVSNIGTLNDLNLHLRKNPQLDEAFNKILNESGYLGVWRFEKNKNPWQYDLDLLLEENVADTVKLHYCVMLDAQAEEGLQRYEVNRAGYTLLVEETGLETFRTFLDLYETLVSLHRQRVSVARQWLQLKAPQLVPKSASPRMLNPHSEEWFEALRKQNPHQAAMTRAAIELAGQTDICSICGDHPSKVYRLVGSELLAQAVNTLRLCNECWQIRRQQYAESPGLV